MTLSRRNFLTLLPITAASLLSAFAIVLTIQYGLTTQLDTRSKAGDLGDLEAIFSEIDNVDIEEPPEIEESELMVEPEEILETLAVGGNEAVGIAADSQSVTSPTTIPTPTEKPRENFIREIFINPKPSPTTYIDPNSSVIYTSPTPSDPNNRVVYPTEVPNQVMNENDDTVVEFGSLGSDSEITRQELAKPQQANEEIEEVVEEKQEEERWTFFGWYVDFIESLFSRYFGSE